MGTSTDSYQETTVAADQMSGAAPDTLPDAIKRVAADVAIRAIERFNAEIVAMIDRATGEADDAVYEEIRAAASEAEAELEKTRKNHAEELLRLARHEADTLERHVFDAENKIDRLRDISAEHATWRCWWKGLATGILIAAVLATIICLSAGCAPREYTLNELDAQRSMLIDHENRLRAVERSIAQETARDPRRDPRRDPGHAADVADQQQLAREAQHLVRIPALVRRSPDRPHPVWRWRSSAQDHRRSGQRGHCRTCRAGRNRGVYPMFEDAPVAAPVAAAIQQPAAKPAAATGAVKAKPARARRLTGARWSIWAGSAIDYAGPEVAPWLGRVIERFGTVSVRNDASWTSTHYRNAGKAAANRDADVTLFDGPYHHEWWKNANFDPRFSDPRYLIDLKDRWSNIRNDVLVGGSKIGGIVLDTECFNKQPPDSPFAADWNRAMTNRYDDVYAAVKDVFGPDMPVEWYRQRDAFWRGVKGIGQTATCEHFTWGEKIDRVSVQSRKPNFPEFELAMARQARNQNPTVPMTMWLYDNCGYFHDGTSESFNKDWDYGTQHAFRLTQLLAISANDLDLRHLVIYPGPRETKRWDDYVEASARGWEAGQIARIAAVSIPSSHLGAKLPQIVVTN